MLAARREEQAVIKLGANIDAGQEVIGARARHGRGEGNLARILVGEIGLLGQVGHHHAGAEIAVDRNVPDAEAEFGFEIARLGEFIDDIAGGQDIVLRPAIAMQVPQAFDIVIEPVRIHRHPAGLAEAAAEEVAMGALPGVIAQRTDGDAAQGGEAGRRTGPARALRQEGLADRAVQHRHDIFVVGQGRVGRLGAVQRRIGGGGVAGAARTGTEAQRDALDIAAGLEAVGQVGAELPVAAGRGVPLVEQLVQDQVVGIVLRIAHRVDEGAAAFLEIVVKGKAAHRIIVGGVRDQIEAVHLGLGDVDLGEGDKIVGDDPVGARRELVGVFLVAAVLDRGQRIAARSAGGDDVGAREGGAGGGVGAVAAQLDVDEGRRLLAQPRVKAFREDVEAREGLPLRRQVGGETLDGAGALEEADIRAFGGIAGRTPAALVTLRPPEPSGLAVVVTRTGQLVIGFMVQTVPPAVPAPGTGPMMVVRWPCRIWSWRLWMLL